MYPLYTLKRFQATNISNAYFVSKGTPKEQIKQCKILLWKNNVSIRVMFFLKSRTIFSKCMFLKRGTNGNINFVLILQDLLASQGYFGQEISWLKGIKPRQLMSRLQVNIKITYKISTCPYACESLCLSVRCTNIVGVIFQKLNHGIYWNFVSTCK